jgi:hypothetical protein
MLIYKISNAYMSRARFFVAKIPSTGVSITYAILRENTVRASAHHISYGIAIRQILLTNVHQFANELMNDMQPAFFVSRCLLNRISQRD